MLHEWKGLIEVFLRDELKLSLNDKTSIRPVRQGVEFVGVRIWATHKKLRKSTVRRIKRETRAICERYAADMDAAKFSRHIASIKGLLEHTESISLKIRLNNIYKTVMENAGYAVTDEPFGHFEKEARTNGKAT